MSGLSRGSGLWNGNTGLWHGNTGLWSGATGLQDGAGGYSPLSLFAAGEQGVWYDPSDFTTMFQDTAGTTPVTAVGQRIALVLDKSKGLVLGPELVTNGDYSNGGTGWTAGVAGVTYVDGVARYSAVSNSFNNRQSGVISPGKTYQVTYTVSNYVTGIIRVKLNGIPSAEGGARSANGTYTELITATSTADGILCFSAGNVFTGDIDNISVKELPGNHASRTTTAQQPILRQTGGGLYYAEFDGIDDSWVTGNIDFSATDEMTVIAGVRKLSDAAAGMVVELSAGSGTGRFAFLAPLSAAANYQYASVGSTAAFATTPSVYAAPITNVLTALSDISADNATVRVNGAQAATSASDQGTGNYAAAQPLYIGRRGGTSIPLNGHLFGLIVRGKTTSGTDLTNAETYMAGKTGVTL